jgi:RNA polymerase sigma factor (TIGR02999 family)
MAADDTRSTQQVTRLLVEWGNGNHAALEKLMPLVYAELHRMAKRNMGRQSPDHTLQATALIHEAWLRLADDPGRRNWGNRGHFFAVAATAMRHVLVDYARAGKSAKRGGERRAVPLDEAVIVSGERLAEVIAVDDALTVLEKLHPRQSKVVELRFFGGLSVEETAEALKVSPETIMRDWRSAKAWLHRELGQETAASEHADDA